MYSFSAIRALVRRARRAVVAVSPGLPEPAAGLFDQVTDRIEPITGGPAVWMIFRDRKQ
jgi:hypothetical protein